MKQFVLKIATSDEKGLIYRIADVIFKYQLNIVKNDEFVGEGLFFFRAILDGEFDKGSFVGTLKAMLPAKTRVELYEKQKKNIVIFATKEAHCLGDLLIKHYSNELLANIKAVISNYEELCDLVEKFELPYHSIKSENLSRQAHEEDSLRVLRAVHFVARFDLKIADESLKFMQTMDTRDLSRDRINAELYKFFKAKNLKRGFEALQKLNLEQTVLLNDSTKCENATKFRQMLERAREFISDESLFLYLYLNFFGIEKKDFFAKTQLKKELLNAAKQPFFKDEMSDLNLAQIALQMPLKSWLGLWDEKRVQRARALKLYDEALRAQINTQELENLGFSGKKLGEQIQKRKNEWLKAYLKGIK